MRFKELRLNGVSANKQYALDGWHIHPIRGGLLIFYVGACAKTEF